MVGWSSERRIAKAVREKQIIQSIVDDKMIDPVAKITCRRVPSNRIIRTCHRRKYMNEL